jgi:NAD(P)-dependent dehydrogenase (short-subunit alcohol dehydrogenase family)
MSGRLKDRVCVITGAAQGIGAAYARACAAEGVLINDAGTWFSG